MSNDNFKKELEELINKYSVENANSTPDYILAHYLLGCLQNYTTAVLQRDKWHGTDYSLDKNILSNESEAQS